MFRGWQIGKGKNMKLIHRCLAAGAMAFALVGCLENRATQNGALSKMETDMALSALQEPLASDSAKGPMLGFQWLSFADELGLTEDQKIRVSEAISGVRERFKTDKPPGKAQPSLQETQSTQIAMCAMVWGAVMGVLDSSQQAKALTIRSHMQSGERPCPRALEQNCPRSRRMPGGPKGP
jgi:hypothetical protein